MIARRLGRSPDDDLVRRRFRPAKPDVLWVADLTYLRTWEGWLYLAAVQAPSAVASSAGRWPTTCAPGLVVDALEMALHRRQPGPGLVHHSDQGSQFASLAFGQRARDAGIAVSMGSKGDCYDNAVARASSRP